MKILSQKLSKHHILVVDELSKENFSVDTYLQKVYYLIQGCDLQCSLLNIKKLFRSISLFRRVVLKGFFVLVLIQFSYSEGSSQYHFTYNAQVEEVYQDITSLKLVLAQEKANYLMQSEPYNLAYTHLLSYIDFFHLFISEDRIEFKTQSSIKQDYLNQIDKGNKQDPYYRFVKAEVLLQWALIELKMDNKLTAGRNIYNAYHLLKDNKEEFPHFIHNYKSLCVIHVLAESLPSWVRSLLGIDGDLSVGEEELALINAYALKNADYFFRAEVAAINSYVKFYQLNDKQKAIADLDSYNLDHRQSPIVAFLKASMALRSGDNEGCLEYLDASPSGSQYADFHYLSFMKGRSLLYKLDPRADRYILAFLEEFEGVHYIKEAYQKLAWHALVIKEDEALYRFYLNKIITEGSDIIDEDIQALQEAEQNEFPQRDLLKSRLLFDGGYYKECRDFLLTLKDKYGNKTDKEALTYYYRSGRVNQQLGLKSEAANDFKKSVELGRSIRSYMACNALIQLGIIQEEGQAFSDAAYYYEQALLMKPDKYVTSLHQKAKSGLERVRLQRSKIRQ